MLEAELGLVTDPPVKKGFVEGLWRKAHAVSKGFWGLAAARGATMPADIPPLVSPVLLLLYTC